MKKIIAMTALTAIVAGISEEHCNAQLQKGNIMVGATIGSTGFGFGGDQTTFNLSLNPSVGYFVKNNLAIGGLVGLNYTTTFGNGSNLGYSVSAFGRYYFNDSKTILLNHTRLFIQGSAGLSGNNYWNHGDNTNTNGIGIGVGAGISYFLSPNIGLEALLANDVTVGLGSSNVYDNLGIRVGFQIYFPYNSLKHIWSETKNEMNGD